MESLNVNMVVEEEEDNEFPVVGDIVFALFDKKWFRGSVEEYRSKNKRDKYFCLFEDGDSVSMSIKSLFRSIPEDSSYPIFVQPEAKATTEGASNFSAPDSLSDGTVDQEKQQNQPIKHSGEDLINNDVFDSARLSHELTSCSLPIHNIYDFSIVHAEGPDCYNCIHKNVSHNEKCSKSFSSLQKYQKHLDLHRKNSIIGIIPNELLEFIGSVVCSVCKKLVGKRCTKGVHPNCEKHLSKSITSTSITSTSITSTSITSTSITSTSSTLPSPQTIALTPKHFLYTTPPAQVIETWREVFTKTIEDLVKFNNVYNWSLYFMLPYCILVRPARGGKKNNSKKAQLSQLYSRLKRWKEGDYVSLWNDATQLIDHQVKNSKSQQSNQQNNQKKVFKLVAQGRYSDACKTVCSTGVAPNGIDTYNKLKSKHPEGPEYATPNNLPKAIEFEIKDVLRSVFTFPRGSSGGMFAWTPDLIKSTLDRDNQTKESRVFTELVNLVSSGIVVDEIRPYLAGASLTALNKEGADVRPIASGDPLRRVVSKCYCYNLVDDIRKHFEPLQHGCSINGTERIIHLFRDLVDKEDVESSKLILKLDMKNAFNSVSRQAIFDAVLKDFPSVSRYVYWCYGKHTLLKYDEYFLTSQLGVQQGDPFGPILFCLALHPIIMKAHTLFPDMVQGWYCDDGQVIASPQVIAEVFSFLVEELKAICLETNFKKTELIALNKSIVSIDQITNDDGLDILNTPYFIPGRNFYTLGAPIGERKYCDQFISSKVEKIEKLITKIVDLDNVQISYNLIYYCCSYGKVVYYSRTIPSEYITDQLIRFDNIIKSSFETLISKTIDDNQLTQLSLPWKEGGLGLRSSSQHSCVAYISSFSHCKEVVASLGGSVNNNYLDYCFQMFNKQSQEFKLHSIDGKLDQCELSRFINAKLKKDLFDRIDIDYKAKLLGITAKYAHYWLTVIPDPSIGFTYNNYEMSTLLKLWLNLDIFPTNNKCPESNCPSELDTKGVHALVCKSYGDRISKHNTIIDVIEKEARYAAKNPYKEVLHLLGSNDDRRPADLFIPNHYQNKSSCLDVGISNPLCPLFK